MYIYIYIHIYTYAYETTCVDDKGSPKVMFNTTCSIFQPP